MSSEHFGRGDLTSGGRKSLWAVTTLKVNKSGLPTRVAVVFSLFAAGIITMFDRSSSTTPVESSETAIERQIVEVPSSRPDSGAPPSPVVAQASPEPIATPSPVAPAMSAQSGDPASEVSTQGAGWPVALNEDFADRPAAATDQGDAAAASNPNVPTECLPEALRAVLADVETRFGPVTIVSTTHLHTANHTPGSIREKLHLGCKAVDIKTPHQPNEVIAFLRSRPEVGGINSYRNQVIHFDLNANYGKTASNPGTAQQRRTGANAQRQPQARVGATAQNPSPKAGVTQARPTSQPTQQGDAASNTGWPPILDQLFSRGNQPTDSPIRAFRE
jgi:Peptidase M15